jgi:hypothetical protein
MNEENDDFVRDPKQWKTGGEPMTDAQRIELEHLANEVGDPSPNEYLTKAEASEQIEQLRREAGHLDEDDETDTVLGDDE